MTDQQYEAIVAKMPDGMNGFMKSWGLKQFAENVHASVSIPKKATPEMRAAFRRAYREGAYREREGEFWANRVDYALDQMLAAATTLEAPVDGEEPPLCCDTCGKACADPWHYSTAVARHMHACDACWGMVPAAPMSTAEASAALAINSALHRIRTGNAAGAIEPLEQARAMLAAAPQAPAAPWKDHQTARLVNDLRDCAKTYHAAGQLRDRIAFIVAPLCDQLKAAQAAPAAPAVDAWLQPDDMAALQRFQETAEDDESHDIGKEAVARLCAFGCLQSRGFGRHSTTAFGDYLLDTWAGARTLPFTTAAERSDRAAQAAAKGA